MFSAGVGFGYYYAGGTTFSANMEFGVSDLISVGPYFGFTRFGDQFLGAKLNYNFYDFGVRGSAHLGEPLGISNEKFDPYVGLMLGYLTSSVSVSGGGAKSSAYGGGVLRYGGHLGARYYLSDSAGIYAEVGYGVVPFMAGITFKF